MIYLIRHADAVSDEVNPLRPLSAKGREQVSRVCGLLRRKAGPEPRAIWHSPLERSRETADLLARGIWLSAPLVLANGLEPDNDPSKIAAILGTEAGDLAVVGHEPNLGVLSSLLVHGPTRGTVYFPFPKAGVLALSPNGPRWKAEWLIRSP
jgi:phosphohistidine phosphatase